LLLFTAVDPNEICRPYFVPLRVATSLQVIVQFQSIVDIDITVVCITHRTQTGHCFL